MRDYGPECVGCAHLKRWTCATVRQIPSGIVDAKNKTRGSLIGQLQWNEARNEITGVGLL